MAQLLSGDNEPVETLEALISNEEDVVEYILYHVEGLGEFRREGGKWIVNTQDVPEQFNEMKIIDLDISNIGGLLAKWDAEEKISEEQIMQYALSEETE
jgi:hypothetical protein